MSRYNSDPRIKVIETYIDFWGKVQKRKGGNIVSTSVNLNFKADIENSKYDNFINFGDYHYFIGRIIFTKGGGVYGFFCAQQCIENYLKAYVIYKTGSLKEKLIKKYSHDLHKWLGNCRRISSNKSFLQTKRAELIITKYDPFNELPRYPVTKRGIYGNSYAYLQPDDIYPLDYFIYRLRKEMPLPKGVWDIFGVGRPYGASSLDKNDPLVHIFKSNNINF